MDNAQISPPQHAVLTASTLASRARGNREASARPSSFSGSGCRSQQSRSGGGQHQVQWMGDSETRGLQRSREKRQMRRSVSDSVVHSQLPKFSGMGAGDPIFNFLDESLSAGGQRPNDPETLDLDTLGLEIEDNANDWAQESRNNTGNQNW